MPPLRVLLRAAGRSAIGWIAAAVFVGFTAGLAMADHVVPMPARGGLDWMSWLLVAGAIAAVSLAAWAFFAPDRADGRSEPTAPDGSEPEPPAR